MFNVLEYQDRNYRELEKPASHSWKEWTKHRNQKSRVYVSLDNEMLLDNLENRHSRPYNVWKPYVEAALRERGFTFDKLRWSQKAGCSCPCSPGFIAEGSFGHDVWITIEDAFTPKRVKPALKCEPVESTFVDLYQSQEA